MSVKDLKNTCVKVVIEELENYNFLFETVEKASEFIIKQFDIGGYVYYYRDIFVDDNYYKDKPPSLEEAKIMFSPEKISTLIFEKPYSNYILYEKHVYDDSDDDDEEAVEFDFIINISLSKTFYEEDKEDNKKLIPVACYKKRV